MIINKNTNTCERSAIKIDERENIQDTCIFIETSFFTWKNSQELKPIKPIRRSLMGYVFIFPPFRNYFTR